MDTQPVLTGELLELRPLKNEDYDALLKAASDPLIWEQHPQSDRWRPEVFAKFFAEAIASKGALKIIDRENGEIIGTTRFYLYSEENSSVKIGYTFIARKYWGGKYNLNLKKMVINHALKYVKQTLFEIGLQNVRSQKAMEKIGGINTGIEKVPVSYAEPKESFIYKIDHPL